jgi:glutamine---fructose-6-phosphate transaminase (isomerizing)
VSRFLEEIQQQPEALREALAFYRGEGEGRLQATKKLCDEKKGPLLFTGMGSSFFAPMPVRGELVEAGWLAEVRDASELLHYSLGEITGETVVVAVSQSGESAETRRIVEKVQGGSRLVTVTNEMESCLGRCGDVVLPMCAGEEEAISTKTYTNTLAILHLLGTVLNGGEMGQEMERLERLADGMEEAIDGRRREIEAAADFLDGVQFLYFIARGPTLAAAHQGALTFNEGAGLPTSALSGGTFRHGPLELVGEEFAGLFFAPKGKTWALVKDMACEVAEGGGRVLLLTDGKLDGLSERVRVLELPEFGEDLFPLNACVPVELLLYEVAHRRGREAGVFERIAKVTRRE